MLPNLPNLINRWFEASYKEEVGNNYVGTSERMGLFEDTEVVANHLKQLHAQGNVDLAYELSNVILKTFDNYEAGESKILAQWISHYSSTSRDEGAYKSLHYLFETLSDIKNSHEALKPNADIPKGNPSLTNIKRIDSTAYDYIKNSRLTDKSILPEIENLFVEAFIQDYKPNEGASLRQTSKTTRQQVAQAFRGRLTDLHITTAAQAITYVKEFGEKLRFLDISNIRFSINELKELIKYLPNLKEFRSRKNIHQMGIEGIKIIANSVNFKNLITLDLSANSLGSEAAKVIADSQYLKNLTSLNLSANHLGPEAAKVIADSENLINLSSLDLSYNKIELEGVKALADSRYLKNLVMLVLMYNKLGEESAKDISASENFKNLNILNLSGNKIGDEGIKSIKNSENLKNLKTLLVKFCL